VDNGTAVRDSDGSADKKRQMNTTISEPNWTMDCDVAPEIGQRIFEKLRVRMAAIQHLPPMPKLKTKTIPDVVVLVDDNAVLLEPQNWRATEWLYNRCNLSAEEAQVRERVRVHPLQWEKIVAELKSAGFEVLS